MYQSKNAKKLSDKFVICVTFAVLHMITNCKISNPKCHIVSVTSKEYDAT